MVLLCQQHTSDLHFLYYSTYQSRLTTHPLKLSTRSICLTYQRDLHTHTNFQSSIYSLDPNFYNYHNFYLPLFKFIKLIDFLPSYIRVHIIYNAVVYHTVLHPMVYIFAEVGFPQLQNSHEVIF